MTTLVRQNIFAAWLDGEVSAIEALRSLCDDYEEIDSSFKDFERLKEQTRDQISTVLIKLDGKAEIKGFGVLSMTNPSVIAGYDKRKIDALVMALIDEGQADLAERIRSCSTQMSRAGTLRIERERK